MIQEAKPWANGIRQWVDPKYSARCRSCDWQAPAPTWRLGETTHSNGSPRAVVVFECVACGELRYLDLATEMPS